MPVMREEGRSEPARTPVVATARGFGLELGWAGGVSRHQIANLGTLPRQRIGIRPLRFIYSGIVTLQENSVSVSLHQESLLGQYHGAKIAC